MTVITEVFSRLANVRRNNLGMPGHPTVIVTHPIASMKPDQVAELADGALHEVTAALTGQGG